MNSFYPSLDSFIHVYDVKHLIPDNFLEMIQEEIPISGRKIERTTTDARYSNHIFHFEETKIEPIIRDYIWSITNFVTENYSKDFLVSYSENAHFNPLKKLYNEEGYFVYMYNHLEFCDIHVDQNRSHPRDISFILMLNDEYEGGIIEFYCGKHLLKQIIPKKYSIVVFPSNYLYAHRVTPVKNGLRVVMVFWLRTD